MGTVAGHQLSTFTTPVNATSPIDANEVRGNDNSIGSSYNAHDADATIHVQNGLVASRPAAGTAGAMWLATDANAQYVWVDSGSVWVEIDYLRNTGGTVDGDVVITGTLDTNDVGSLWAGTGEPEPGNFLYGGRVYAAVPGASGLFQCIRSNGTFDTPTAVVSGDQTGYFGGTGYDGDGIPSTCGAFVTLATENWSATAHGTKVVLRTVANTTTAQIDALTLNHNGRGQFKTGFSVGDATPATSGAGMTFPASQSASTDVNTLDDYEEGTWTPSLGGSTTYAFQSGVYVKIGKWVFVRAILGVTLIGTGSTTVVSGLPFAVVGTGDHGGGIGYFENLATNVVFLTASPNGGASTITFRSLAAAAGTLGASAIFGNSTRVDFSACYETTA